MRTWERVTYSALCGQCHAQLGEGQVMQVIQLLNVKRRLIRCEECAEGQPPPDLPSNPVSQRTTKRMLQIGAVKPEWLPYREAE